MSDAPYDVGYRKPPVHTRFQKGQSGNPGGKPGPQKLLRHQLEAALGEALNADEGELRNSKPTKVMDILAQKFAVLALNGDIVSQRFVLSLVDRQARYALSECAAEMKRPPPVFAGPEHYRELLGERYEEFEKRFREAIAAESVDKLMDVAVDLEAAKFAASGNS